MHDAVCSHKKKMQKHRLTSGAPYIARNASENRWYTYISFFLSHTKFDRIFISVHLTDWIDTNCSDSLYDEFRHVHSLVHNGNQKQWNMGSMQINDANAPFQWVAWLILLLLTYSTFLQFFFCILSRAEHWTTVKWSIWILIDRQMGAMSNWPKIEHDCVIRV